MDLAQGQTAKHPSWSVAWADIEIATQQRSAGSQERAGRGLGETKELSPSLHELQDGQTPTSNEEETTRKKKKPKSEKSASADEPTRECDGDAACYVRRHGNARSPPGILPSLGQRQLPASPSDFSPGSRIF